MDPTKWNTMLDKVDLTDSSQKEMAAHISAKFAGKKPAPKSSLESEVKKELKKEDIDEENPSSIERPKFPRNDTYQEAYDQMMTSVETGTKLLGLDGLVRIVHPKKVRRIFVS